MFELVFHACCCYLFPMLILLHFLHNIRRLLKAVFPHSKGNPYDDFLSSVNFQT